MALGRSLGFFFFLRFMLLFLMVRVCVCVRSGTHISPMSAGAHGGQKRVRLESQAVATFPMWVPETKGSSARVLYAL